MSAEFVDTNIALYSLSDDMIKRRQALAILVDQPVLSLQVLNEAANVMRRKLGFDIPAIREVLSAGCAKAVCILWHRRSCCPRSTWRLVMVFPITTV